ncbi:hypothetical protein Hanom_Chr17g01530411 [Helianthus anomalus]
MVPNLRNRHRVHFRYRLLTFSVPIRYRYLPVFTLKYRYRTRYIWYRDFGTGTSRYQLTNHLQINEYN